MVDLAKNINSFCRSGGGLEELWVRAFITAHCLTNDISCDTYNWDQMIDYLWDNLVGIIDNFDSKYAFDLFMGGDLS